MTLFLWFIGVVGVSCAVRYIENLGSRIEDLEKRLETETLEAQASILNIDSFIQESKALADDRAAYNSLEYLAKKSRYGRPHGLSWDHQATFRDSLDYYNQWAKETPHEGTWVDQSANTRMEQAQQELQNFA